MIVIAAIALAAGCGVLLAAADRPQADNARIERYSKIFLAAAAITTVATVVQQLAS